MGSYSNIAGYNTILLSSPQDSLPASVAGLAMYPMYGYAVRATTPEEGNSPLPPVLKGGALCPGVGYAKSPA